MEKFVEINEAEEEEIKERKRRLLLLAKITSIIGFILIVISSFMAFLPYVKLIDSTGEVINKFSLIDLMSKENEGIGRWPWLIGIVFLNCAGVLLMIGKIIIAFKQPKRKSIAYCLDYASGSFLMISGILQFLVIIMVSGTKNPYVYSLKIDIGSIIGGITGILGAVSVWFYASQKYKKPKVNKKTQEMIEKEA